MLFSEKKLETFLSPNLASSLQNEFQMVLFLKNTFQSFLGGFLVQIGKF